jgi:hypothetical protein
MKSEEIAVLRILYKHHGPIKLSALIEGFPDQSKSVIVDAVSRLQLISYLNVTDCSSVLYVAINRHMRGTVLDLIKNDSERYNANRTKEKELQIGYPIQAKHTKLRSESSCRPDLEVCDNKDLWLRLPKRAIKLGASMLVFSFVILGTISALNSQSTTSSSTYEGIDESTSFMLASSALADEIQKGKTVPVEHFYNSDQNKEYSSEPAIYEGIFTKIVSEPSPYDNPPLYYHYLISEKQGLLLLEPVIQVTDTNDMNSSLSAMTDNHDKEISST